MNLVPLLRELCEIDGPSGHEDAVRRVVARELADYVQALRVDGMGNLIGQMPGRDPLRVVIDAHMDEGWSLVISDVEPEGFLRVMYLSGHRWCLEAQRVRVLTRGDVVPGVIGIKSCHALGGGLSPVWYEPVRRLVQDAYIDVGARTREEVEALGIRAGDVVCLDRDFEELAHNTVTAKAFDNRAGLVVMIETVKRLARLGHLATICPVATVEEEGSFGFVGTATACRQLRPHVMVALDVAPAGDVPDTSMTTFPVRLGRGPVLGALDTMTRYSPRLNDLFMKTAKEKGIPYQVMVVTPPQGFASEAVAAWEGGRAYLACLLVPTRYTHTPVETLRLDDLEASIELLTQTLSRISSTHFPEVRAHV